MPSEHVPTHKAVRSIDGIITPPPSLVDDDAPKSKRRPNRRTIRMAGGIVVAIALVVGGVTLFTRNGDVLPSSFVKNAGFPIYYPSPVTQGYSYQQGSAKDESSIAVYTLKNGSSTIIVSEQAAPSTPPDLSHLFGFTSLKTLAGNAAIGATSAKQPIVIILSNTTLITMTGNSGLPSDVVAPLAQNMRSL